MTEIEKAKSMFPYMPSEVFKMLIADQLGDDEWPFSNIYDTTRRIDDWGNFWHYLFGGLSLYELSQLRWQRSNLIVNKNVLHPNSIADVNILINKHIKKIPAPSGWHIDNSEARFLRHIEFIKRTGHLVAPIVTIRANSFFRILDGTHRTAAWYMLYDDTSPIDVWIGEPVTNITIG